MIEPMTDEEREYQEEFRGFANRLTCEDPMYAIQDASVLKSDTTGDLTYTLVLRTRCREPVISNNEQDIIDSFEYCGENE